MNPSPVLYSAGRRHNDDDIGMDRELNLTSTLPHFIHETILSAILFPLASTVKKIVIEINGNALPDVR